MTANKSERLTHQSVSVRNCLLHEGAAEKESRPLLLRVCQILTWFFGICLIAWAFIDPEFRNAEGSLNGKFCLPLSGGIAFIILSWTMAGRFKRFAFWFVLALVGQAVALQMIEAGPFVRYQHYKPLHRLLTENPLHLAYIAAQTILVAAGFRSCWPAIRNWTARNFRVWQVFGVGLLFFLSSATVSREISVYVTELLFAGFVQAVNLGNILLVVWSFPMDSLSGLRRRIEALLGEAEVEYRRSRIQSQNLEPESRSANITGVDRFAVLAASWVTLVAALLSVFVYERIPHIQDELIYLYHASYLADWRLTVPAPPVPEAFSLYMIPYASERWYSIFPPGWPAMLALGVLVGGPWLINPVLAGLNLLLAYLFIQEIYDRRVARMAAFLLCISPWYVFMAMNFMAHTFTLTCALSASLAIARARRTASAAWGLVAGVAVGAVSLIRPLDGLVMAAVLGAWAVGFWGKRLKALSIAGFVLGTVVVASIVLPYNKALTGDPTVFPLNAYYERYFGPKTNALGFGPERGLGWPIDPFPGHSPVESVINANLNVFSINIELFGWSTGSLFFIAVILFSGKLRGSDYLMLALAATVVGIYSYYWFSGGPDFGARYWYLLLVPLVVLTVRGIETLERVLQPAPYGSAHTGVYATIAVISLCTLSLMNYFPWRALDKYHRYLGMRPDIHRLAKQHGFGTSLVLIHGDEHPDYASAWTYNPLDPYAQAPVYAWDRNLEVRAEVLRAYPDRPIWILNGPTITHGGFQVVAGPLSAHDLAAQGSQLSSVFREPPVEAFRLRSPPN